MAQIAHREVIASFIIDVDPMYGYMGWNLAQSLALRSEFEFADIHIHFTPGVADEIRKMFEAIGCSTHRIQPFGDGKYCNKLAQWEALRGINAESVIFLDTDMICVSNIREFLPWSGNVGAKIVDLTNPSIEVLDGLFDRLGLVGRPELVRVDADEGVTFAGNCNGGLYAVPTSLADPLFATWKDFASRLLHDLDPLLAIGKEMHVDQIAFCMAVHDLRLPVVNLPANINYFAHFKGEHSWLEEDRPLALLHYHGSSLNMLGLLEPNWDPSEFERAAFSDANAIIDQVFNTRLFWDFRYAHFPDRGSGVGSRGENLAYKRELLRREGIEQASSVLDVGCGDLEVVKSLNLKNYTGIDASERSLAAAASARPDWKFKSADASDIPAGEMVLCLEVAIHQKSHEEYRALIDLIAAKTERTLIVSGFDAPTADISSNHMVFFYEPLRDSLTETGKFKSIRPIGQHTTVTIYRCDV